MYEKNYIFYKSVKYKTRIYSNIDDKYIFVPEKLGGDIVTGCDITLGMWFGSVIYQGCNCYIRVLQDVVKPGDQFFDYVIDNIQEIEIGGFIFYISEFPNFVMLLEYKSNKPSYCKYIEMPSKINGKPLNHFAGHTSENIIISSEIDDIYIENFLGEGFIIFNSNHTKVHLYNFQEIISLSTMKYQKESMVLRNPKRFYVSNMENEMFMKDTYCVFKYEELGYYGTCRFRSILGIFDSELNAKKFFDEIDKPLTETYITTVSDGSMFGVPDRWEEECEISFTYKIEKVMIYSNIVLPNDRNHLISNEVPYKIREWY